MSGDDLVDFHAAHTVQVQQPTRAGSGGTAWTDPAPVDGWLARKTQLIVDAAGESQTSLATFSTDPANADRFTLDARVTTPDGPARVLRVSRPDGGGVIDSLDRVKVWLQ